MSVTPQQLSAALPTIMANYYASKRPPPVYDLKDDEVALGMLREVAAKPWKGAAWEILHDYLLDHGHDDVAPIANLRQTYTEMLDKSCNGRGRRFRRRMSKAVVESCRASLLLLFGAYEEIPF